MSKPNIVIANSFCTLENFQEETLTTIRKILTYENQQIQQELAEVFRLYQMAKSNGHRKMMYAMRGRIEKIKDLAIVCWLKGDKFPTGHLPIVCDRLEKDCIEFQVTDRRMKPSNFNIFRWRTPPPKLRYYQEEIVAAARENERGVFEAAVGTGKTRIVLELIKNFGVNSLVVVPSAALLEQFYRALLIAFGKPLVSVITTPKVRSGSRLAPIRITTVQTLASLSKQGLLDKVVGDTDFLYIDEFHHTGSKSYTDPLPKIEQIYYRFGGTGTFRRNDSKTLDMLGVLSNVIYRYSAKKGIAEGFLTPVEFRIVDIRGQSGGNYQKEYSRHFCAKKDILKATYNILAQIPKDQQVLILVDRKEKSGNIVHRFLEELGFPNTYITGDDDKETIANAISDFNEKKVRVMIGSTVIGEGVDVHSAQNLILLTGGKSSIKIVQAVGRCVRLHPGKERSYVYDFNFSGTRWLAKHCKARIKLYKTEFAGEVTWVK